MGLSCCGGGIGPTDHSEKYEDIKHILVLVDSNAEHRKEIADTMMSLYHVIEFDDIWKAFDFMQKTLPGIVLVGAKSDQGSGYQLIRAMRKEERFSSVPIVMSLHSELAVNAARDCGADDWLVKPYRRSALIKMVTGRINKTVEKAWETLPAIQAKALKGTVEMFNSLSDFIDKGEPIIYEDVSKVCAPVVEAVNSDDYKGILASVRGHDNYTYVHSLRVSIFLCLFGRTIGLPEDEQQLLTTGGLLADVGKMIIPHLVLNKSDKLSPEEFEVMKGHVNASVRILEVGNMPKGVITIAGQHHEKLDGSGYPRGLKADELNELARMAAIVDIFAALTDRRSYKNPMPPDKALDIMIEEMGSQLDIKLLTHFKTMLLDAAIDVA